MAMEKMAVGDGQPEGIPSGCPAVILKFTLDCTNSRVW